MSTDAMRGTRAKLATIRIKRLRCPRCKGTQLRRYHSTRDQGDGTSLAYVKCLRPSCGERFKVLEE